VSIAARVIRSFARGPRLALLVELPCSPFVGMRLILPDADGRRIVDVVRVTVEAREWTPGVYTAAVEIETAPEPPTAADPAERYGWKPVPLTAPEPTV
jgi:hypothetical protein